MQVYTFASGYIEVLETFLQAILWKAFQIFRHILNYVNRITRNLKCNRLLKLGQAVGAVTLSRWEWWWNERWIWGAKEALNLISTNYPDHGHHGRLPLSRKNHMVELGIKPGTSWIAVRNSDHQAMRLVASHLVSSLSVKGRTVCRFESGLQSALKQAYCTAVYREWRYQRL